MVAVRKAIIGFFGSLSILSSSLICTSPKICLAIQMEEEEDEIIRSLESVKGLVDCVVISHIGSQNSSIEIVKQFLDQHQIPVQIYSTIETHLARNKTQLILHAQHSLHEWGCVPEESFLLMLDPGMEVHLLPDFCKTDIGAHSSLASYLLLSQSSPSAGYGYRLLLLSAALSWENIGMLTDEWVSPIPCPAIQISNLWCSGPKRNYTAEDLQLMRQQLLRESNPRPKSVQFFANICQELGLLEEAISWHKQCTLLSRDPEEIWFSQLMLGKCFQEQGKWSQALDCYLEAYQYNTQRAESMFLIADYYHQMQYIDLAHAFATYGLQIPSDPRQTLFYYSPLCSRGLKKPMEPIATSPSLLAILATTDALVQMRNIPDKLKDHICQTLPSVVTPLLNTRFQKIEFDRPRLRKPFQDKYVPLNPSIIATPTGYTVLCRTVNYTQQRGCNYSIKRGEKIFKTRNFLLEYNSSFELQKQREIIEHSLREKITAGRGGNTKGVEDCRLFEWNQQLFCTGTTYDTSICEVAQLSLCSLQPLPHSILIDQVIPLEGPNPYRIEKNWLPFIFQDQLLMIYSHDPFLILKIDPTTGASTTHTQHVNLKDFSRFRGSAPPIPFEEGFLVLIHEVITFPNWHRHYLHRFVYLDRNFEIQKISRLFTFTSAEIEFCCGMVAHTERNELILPIGIEDREAFFCFVSMDTVKSMLFNINP